MFSFWNTYILTLFCNNTSRAIFSFLYHTHPSLPSSLSPFLPVPNTHLPSKSQNVLSILSISETVFGKLQIFMFTLALIDFYTSIFIGTSIFIYIIFPFLSFSLPPSFYPLFLLSLLSLFPSLSFSPLAFFLSIYISSPLSVSLALSTSHPDLSSCIIHPVGIALMSLN